MFIYVKFTITTHQIWSCHVTLASNSEDFYFLPNSISNFRTGYQIWGKLAQEQNATGKKQIGGGKQSPVLREVSFCTGKELPKIGAIRYFFSDQKGIKRFFQMKRGDHLYFLKETKYFVKHFRFQRN